MPKDDIISRQAALDIIDSELNGWLTDDERLHLEGLAIGISCLPTIDPVKHGTWLKYPGDIVSDDGLWGETLFDCSVCGHTIHVATEYCAKCGAKMEQDGEIQVRWKDETN